MDHLKCWKAPSNFGNYLKLPSSGTPQCLEKETQFLETIEESKTLTSLGYNVLTVLHPSVPGFWMYAWKEILIVDFT